MPAQESMRFYRGNRPGGGFDADLNEVAAQFWASPQGRPHAEDPDHQGPLNKSLCLFLTDPAGFNSTWEDEAGYGELFRKVREAWPEEPGPVVEETEPCLMCGEPSVPVGKGPLCERCEAGQEAEGAR